MVIIPNQRARTAGYVALAIYIACIFAANYFIQHVGHVSFPGGPHTVTVWPDWLPGATYAAPSGVLWVGVAFTMRDVVQSNLGRVWTVVAILIGALLSFWVAPSLAFASGSAFLLGEMLDFLVYTPLAEQGKLIAGVIASNVVGSLVDTILFLWIAFHSLTFWQGQLIGKTLMIIPGVLVVWALRRERAMEATA